MAKRTANTDLNHDNWDREDEPEDAGSFTRASEESLKKRVIKVAKRRNPITSSAQNEEEKSSIFSGFSGFANKTSTPSNNTFGFLSNLSKNNEPEVKTNGISDKPVESEKLDKTPDEYYAKLKGLNESVTEWIKKHVTANPFISLQPIFKDYDKYFADLEKLKTGADKEKVETTTTTTSTKQFSFGSTAPVSMSFGATSASSTFSFGSKASTSSTFSFSEGAKPSFSFSAAPSNGGSFSFTAKPPEDKKSETVAKATEEDVEDEPPKVEFKQVVEEGNVFSIRCKVFVKNKEGNYGDRGVGTLYLKPVPDSEKVQLIVRADTNLGNLICNFILSESIPVQRMGKKDVMLITLPTPDEKPPPVPILIRVKSTEDADELAKTLEKHKK